MRSADPSDRSLRHEDDRALLQAIEQADPSLSEMALRELAGYLNEHLSPTEAARFLGLAAITLARMRVTGAGPVYVKVGARVLYVRSDLLLWRERRRCGSTCEYPTTPGPGRRKAARKATA